MANIINKPLRVATFGMDNRTREILRMAFERPGKGCSILVDEASAEAGIFNMDCADSKELWAEYKKQHPQRPTIVISIKDPGIENAVFVAKPVRIDNLLNAITKVQHAHKHMPSTPEIKKSPTPPPKHRVKIKPAPDLNTLQKSKGKISEKVESIKSDDSEFCGNASDVNISDPIQKATLFYTPKDYLQGEIDLAVQAAIKKRSAATVNIMVDNKWQSITLLPSENRVVTTLDDSVLRYLCTTPRFCLAIKTRYSDYNNLIDLEQKTTHHNNESLIEPFLWKVALWSSRGCLPKGTKIMAPVSLERWPNFTRLQMTPYAMSIAAMLIDEPRSLALVLKVLNIPQRFVFAFYSAAVALKYIDATKVHTPKKTIENNKADLHPLHGLFGRILMRLKRAS